MSEWITNQKKQNDPTSVMPRGESTRGGRVPGAMVVVIKRGANIPWFFGDTHHGSLYFLRDTVRRSDGGVYSGVKRGSVPDPSPRGREPVHISMPPSARTPETEPEPRADWANVAIRLNVGAGGSVRAATSSKAIKAKVIHATSSANASTRFRGVRGAGGCWGHCAVRAGYQQRRAIHDVLGATGTAG
ncbi:mitochondrial tricarboxylate transporter [Colletotrichum sojae]|uniref:Mitochondrial tricarboxylate transporter n=1 Tax=Colletotrichum sojae TaxID=2175907 RepID=A0A8H6MRP6_9PEZI|nr:mitochondrial tricarboxylate transporter [Colletotrichum sojae]